MFVYLSEYIHPDAVKLLEQHGEITNTFNRIREIDAIILRTTNIACDIIPRANSLKVIVEYGVGCNTIDLETTEEYRMPVVDTPKANTNPVAELIIGLILNMCRGVTSCDAKSRHEGSDRIVPPEMTDIELASRIIDLIGMDNIILRTDKILKNGFDTILVGYDPYCMVERAAIFGIKKYNDLNKMLEVSDIVNINVPLISSTKNLITDDSFPHFKKDAILTSAARGGIANGDDLYTVLETRQLRAAACDAFVKESPTGENKLTKLNNSCATPHTGADTEEALYRMGVEAAKAVIGVIEGNAAKYRVV